MFDRRKRPPHSRADIEYTDFASFEYDHAEHAIVDIVNGPDEAGDNRIILTGESGAWIAGEPRRMEP